AQKLGGLARLHFPRAGELGTQDLDLVQKVTVRDGNASPAQSLDRHDSQAKPGESQAHTGQEARRNPFGPIPARRASSPRGPAELTTKLAQESAERRIRPRELRPETRRSAPD